LILGAIIVVLGGAVAFAAANLNAYLNRNRAWIAEQAGSALGRKVTFEEIGVSVLGGFGARLTDLRIADDPAFSTEDFVRAGRVQVSVKILPALFGRFEVGRFLLVQPEITVIQTAAGLNVESIGATEAKPEPGAPPRAEKDPGEKPAAEPAGGALPLLIAAVDVEGGALRFIDRTAPGKAGAVTIEQFDFSASDVGFESPIAVKMAAALLGSAEQNLRVEGTVGPVGDPATLDTAAIPVAAAVTLDPIDIAAVRRAVPAVATQFPPELTIEGPLRFSARIAGSTGAPTVSDLTLTADDAAIAYGATFTKPKKVPLQLEVDGKQAGGALELEAVRLRLAELAVAGSGSVGMSPPMAANMKIAIERTALKGWDRLVPALAGYALAGAVDANLRVTGALADGGLPKVEGTVGLHDVGVRVPDAPEIAGLSSTIALKGNAAVVPASKFTVGGSPVELEATVERFDAPVVKFALRSPELRMASLGLEDASGGKDALRSLTVDGTADTRGATPAFEGRVRSPAGQLQAVSYGDLAVDLRLRDGVATLEKLSLKAFGGTYDGKGRYDMTNAARPAFAFTSALRQIQLQQLLASYFPAAASQIEGSFTGDLTLNGAGAEWETIKKTLTGNGKAAVNDGKLRGLNIAEAVLGNVTGVPGLSALVPPKVQAKYPELFAHDDTTFERFEGTVRIADGRVATDDLRLAARDYQIRGGGWFSLDKQVDFTATLVASQRMSRDMIEGVSLTKYLANSEGRVEIPFRMAGSLPGVRPQPDVRVIAKAAEGALVKEGLEKLLGGGALGQPVPSAPGATAPSGGKPSGGTAIDQAIDAVLPGFQKPARQKAQEPAAAPQQKQQRQQRQQRRQQQKQQQ
jgi:hypothetical protein